MTSGGLATRRTPRLRADPSRVIAQLFVPGHALPGEEEGRASGVVSHILAISEAEVEAALADVLERFEPRHPDIVGTFERHADRIGNRVGAGIEMSRSRRLLLGATFTAECAVEGAALCNPSAVPLPDQSTAPEGGLRFVMSVRQIGEGHRSSIGLRTGTLGEDGAITVDATGPHASAGVVGPPALQANIVRGVARRRDEEDAEATSWVLDGLGDQPTIEELELRLVQLEAQRDTRRNVTRTVRRLRDLVARAYTVDHVSTSGLSDRVLHPVTSVESNGMEDARLVRFVDDDGSVTYYATYTAYNGHSIVQQLLATTDFGSWRVMPIMGRAAANKGLALFPRRVGGRYAAMTRCDGLRNGVAFSDDLLRWPSSASLDCPIETWEAIQVGNCGPPIETDAGWLVLTHGVGPMRTYSIGAWLLDLDDPTRILGRLTSPLLSPDPEEQDGYVPNVVYSCGGLVHAGTLLFPYGIGDASIGFATASLADVLAAMEPLRP
jgi:predicted GH43/DUF377 family glycosyl hydrolase